MKTVNLSEIESVNRGELSSDKLSSLENSYDSFEYQLNSSSNPIAVDCSSRPYKIIDGRHRVYLTRQKGYSTVTVNVCNT